MADQQEVVRSLQTKLDKTRERLRNMARRYKKEQERLVKAYADDIELVDAYRWEQKVSALKSKKERQAEGRSACGRRYPQTNTKTAP